MIKKMSLVLIALFLSVLLLVSSGCGVPQKDYDALSAQLANVQGEYNATNAQLATVQNDYNITKSQLDSLQKQYSTAQSQLGTLQEQVKTLQGTVDSQTATLAQRQKQVADLESRINSILDTKLTLYYKFYFKTDFVWGLPLPLKTYLDYKVKSRTEDVSKYDSLAKDTSADTVFNILVKNLEDAAITYNMTKLDAVNMVATFMQNLANVDRSYTTPYDMYTRYPLETLIEQQGDCADTSVLTAAILVREGYDVAFFVFEEAKHIAIGVNVPAVGTSWEYKGATYYFLETTGGNKWQVGNCPFQYQFTRPLIYPIAR